MKKAFEQAEIAYERGEVPVGAVVVFGNQIIARAHNMTETLNDVTAHAEMIAITSAAEFLGSKYLEECTLYVTLEPCSMCAGALNWSQVSKVVYGASDIKRGYHIYSKDMLHSKTEVVGGVMENECSQLIKSFFNERR